jgi:hypothetical protein
MQQARRKRVEGVIRRLLQEGRGLEGIVGQGYERLSETRYREQSFLCSRGSREESLEGPTIRGTACHKASRRKGKRAPNALLSS